MHDAGAVPERRARRHPFATGASWGLAHVLGVPYAFDLSINLLALVFSAFIGAVFGYSQHAARRAWTRSKRCATSDVQGRTLPGPARAFRSRPQWLAPDAAAERRERTKYRITALAARNRSTSS